MLLFFYADDVKRVLIGCTGSVAALKIPLLIEELQKTMVPMEIILVPTKNSLHFFDCKDLNIKVHLDEDEWTLWSGRSDPVLHIELRKWADLCLLAPLDANTLAKISHGICDNLLTCVVRAWDLSKPLYFAPAMNTHMWDHPITARQIMTLKEFGFHDIPCIEKTLVCGDRGMGAMAEVNVIVKAVTLALTKTSKVS